jgi:tripartite ATP-independent transporter DctM subunit
VSVVLVFALFLALMFAGTPVAYSLGFVSLMFVAFVYDLPISIVVERMIFGVNEFTFLAVPFFILAGNLMTVAGITKQLVTLSSALVGRTRGGLSHTTVVSCMIMSGMTGSDLADASATGSLLLPAMRRAGYPKSYGAAIVAAAATAGPIIPPSIAFVIYGLLTNTSVAALFVAGAIPGVLLGLYLLIAGYLIARIRGFPMSPPVSLRETSRAFVTALPALTAPVIILGGIFSGVFTPTEAAAVAVLYVLLIGMFVYRKLRAPAVGRVVLESLKTSGAVMFIVALSATFSWVVALQQLGPKMTELMTSLTSSPVVFLLCVNILLLILGCVMESIPIMLIFVPILFPTVKAYGIDPVHFGVVVTLNLTIGLSTPPFGLTMFLMCRMAGISMAEYIREYWPLCIALVACLFTISFFPSLVLFLPHLVLGR